ncbi:MAG: 4-(cytidine 5'-diphospho)-2-C-methyl-D-erythritol kinase [Acidobacteriota bacterium]|nr:4-(cytidine 5'-diphospho)-2-C-methyl-D-erythritol kinase [Acidobacteriota bacterium]
MAVTVRSFAKINLGLSIGPARPDRFHALETVYQTVSVHDLIHVEAASGDGIEIRCQNPAVPCGATNTCYRVAERMMRFLGRKAELTITIDKHLPVQGGLGAGSANAVATIFALERELGQPLPAAERLRIAAEVGSDLPLFLLGGTVLGVGRGEEVYPLQDLPAIPCLLITPPVAVSTPQAFRDWDALVAREAEVSACAAQAGADATQEGHLTAPAASVKLNKFSLSAFEWLSHLNKSGVPVETDGDRAETPLLDLVRAGIENDFERVVFPQYPELRDVKRRLEREGADYASLSGSGSTMYGLFRTRECAVQAAEKLSAEGLSVTIAETLTRCEYRAQRFV